MDSAADKIKAFAERAHTGQEKKASGEPYIQHVYRVYDTCTAYTDDMPTLAAALLHDTLEKTKVTEIELEAFLNDHLPPGEAAGTLQMVKELTDKYTTAAYPLMGRKKRKEKEHERLAGISATAQTIKYADVIDNCLMRARYIPAESVEAIKRYRSLLQKLDKGNPRLREKAISIVEECIIKVKG